MEDKLKLDDVTSSLRERVFFAARDGMSLTLYALLYEKNTDEIDDLLNSVSTDKKLSFMMFSQKLYQKFVMTFKYFC